ncbi:right-handed parallel beta-helix repeat-containing protein [Pleurocapsa sp. PCC 7319]|uniref:right-handed parallel beta-helix repeat-containing protein n=1 Tax=Pleurocapsa sp. PCC 7319 TaxID=118161 RepID=UPI00034A8E3E|nr:right-handed parallel beta-helix repeat-containing protein [Pleurocapsa sp. PCC 7319]
MLVNSDTFNLEPVITDDWGGSHRFLLNVEALSDISNWSLEVSVPNDYILDQIYGAESFQENGKTFISGVEWNQDLNQGEQTEIVFIVDEGDSSNLEPIPLQFNFADSVNNSVSPEVDNDDLTPTPQQSDSNDSDNNSNSLEVGDEANSETLSLTSIITDDWGGSHRVALTVEALSDVSNWSVEVSVPDDYVLDQIYRAELFQENGKTFISGEDWNQDLDQGEQTEIIFIVLEGDSSDLAPIPLEFNLPGNMSESDSPGTDSNDLAPTPPVSSPEVVNNSGSQDVNNDNNGYVAQPDSDDNRIINVDSDYGGDLESAIAAAASGDVILLGANIYFTDGITISEDITIDGQEGSVINGNGTSESIIYLNSGASGTTIQDVEITNGNNGIYGSRAANLTLRNLFVNNIGITETIRDGINNSGIALDHADGLQLSDSVIRNVGRKGVGVGDTDGAVIDNVEIQNVNLAAEHSLIHDAAGIKFFNTNDIVLKNSYFSDINAINIWPDTANATTIDNNVLVGVGEDFLLPDFNQSSNRSGIYNEKSSNSLVQNNTANTANDDFVAFRSTEFSTETLTLGENDFSSIELGTTDYWVDESAEKLIALTEDPDEANFDLIADAYLAQANIGV